MADDAGPYEPVSRPKFPDNWEITGKFAGSAPDMRTFARDQRAVSKVWRRNSHTQKLGIFMLIKSPWRGSRWELGQVLARASQEAAAPARPPVHGLLLI